MGNFWATRYPDIAGEVSGDELVSLVYLGCPPAANKPGAAEPEIPDSQARQAPRARHRNEVRQPVGARRALRRVRFFESVATRSAGMPSVTAKAPSAGRGAQSGGTEWHRSERNVAAP
jgi:hypothetical protein